MIPSKLILKNFRCYSEGQIDFNKFNAAVIVGYQAGNASVSNAVGKTAIFDAIEYVLFNNSRSKLDNLINDNSEEMSVTFEFHQDDDLYKIVRERTRKSADVSLFKLEDKKWKDLSGRRASDTEASISSLLRIDYSTFKTTAYFSQKDDFSLALITPEKRKTLLKEILEISAYSKLEKAAKDEFSLVEKEADKLTTRISIFEKQLESEPALLEDKRSVEYKFSQNMKNLDKIQDEMANVAKRSVSVKENIATIKRDNEELIKHTNFCLGNQEKLSKLLKNLQSQKSVLLQDAKQCVASLEALKTLELPPLDGLQDQISNLKIEIANLNKDTELQTSEFKKLQVPQADTEICSLCGSKLDLEHLAKEKLKIESEKTRIKKILVDIDSKLFEKNRILKEKTAELLALKQQYVNKEKNVERVSQLQSQLAVSRDNFKSVGSQISATEAELESARLAVSQLPSIEDLKIKISFYEKELADLEEQHVKASNIEKSILRNNIDYNSALAIVKSKLEEIEKSKVSIGLLKNDLEKLQLKLRCYPYVIQAFSSTGIPSIIIASILDSLQEESNNILLKIHPGLQLQFLTEKERKKDKEVEDKLGIVYFAHSKERSYEELSGAQSIAVQFALKLGLAFLLQKSSNYNFGLLLLDEVDSPLDKQSISYFTEVLKSFQESFKILTITHNDYSKEKLSNQIIVEQDKTKMLTTIKEN